jgi:ABC-2 type transport system permease protein
MNLIQSFKHYARIFWVQIKNNYVREAIYRSNFITSLIVDLIWFGIEFALFGVIYQHTDTLGGWTRDQTYFFLGRFLFIRRTFHHFLPTEFLEFLRSSE